MYIKVKRKKSILFLTRLYHPHIGGVEKHIQEVIPHLQNQGFNVSIITEKYSRELKNYEIWKGVSIYRIPATQTEALKKFYIWKWILAHMDIFYPVDIIHVHDVFYWILPIRLMLLFKKIYITFHGYEGYPIKLKWILMRKMSEKLVWGSICVGEFMKKWYKASPTSIIYGGVRLNIKKTSPKKNTAIFFGRLDDQTGVLEYVKAYLSIKKTITDFEMTVIGEGPLLGKIPKGIRVLKFSKDIERHISENEFIFVSRYLSMLEALIQGRKIVAVYDNPIKKDYLLMSPFRKYINIGKNADEIAKIVIQGIKNPLRQEHKAKEGMLWAQKQTWEKIADKYMRLWSIKT